MEKPIRILQVLGIVGGGGVEAVILEYYKHINRDKVQFDFIVHDDNKIDITEQIDAMGGRVYKVTPYYKNPIAFMIEVYHIIRKYNYKIIHVNMNTLSVFSLFPAWIAKVPVRILHNHSTSSPGEAKRNILKSILRPFSNLFATHYWACSNFAALWMYGQKVAKTDNKVTIIHNAINLEKFAFDLEKRNQLRHSLGLEGKFVVGHVGRFVFQKNHEFLIDVFNFALQQQPNLELMLIGDGPLKSLMQKKTKLLKINNKVKFLGIRDDVADLYNAMDVFIFPSNYEGLGMVGVEAQTNGLNVLASTAVPLEMKCTELVKYKRLSDGVDSWGRVIVEFSKSKLGRRTSIEDLRKAGFDIKVESKRLMELYENINDYIL